MYQLTTVSLFTIMSSKLPCFILPNILANDKEIIDSCDEILRCEGSSKIFFLIFFFFLNSPPLISQQHKQSQTPVSHQQMATTTTTTSAAFITSKEKEKKLQLQPYRVTNHRPDPGCMLRRERLLLSWTFSVPEEAQTERQPMHPLLLLVLGVL